LPLARGRGYLLGMGSLSSPPVIGIPCDIKMLGPHPFHAVGEKYIRAVIDGAQGLPLLLPVPPEPLDPKLLLDRIDGLMLTGSWSNVEPSRYGGPAPLEGTLLDPQRDETVFPLIKLALARGLPLLAICRGFQELNVARGGSLFQHLAEAPGRFDHREDVTASLDVQYGPAHDVTIDAGGILGKILGAKRITVNSLHAQGIDRLGQGLRVEATAEDGTVEAVSVADAQNFALAVQWHPEWKVTNNPDSMAIFQAFGAACRQAA